MIPQVLHLLIKRTGWLSIGRIAMALSQLAGLLIFSQKLSVDQYGYYLALWMIISLLSVLLLWGLPSVLLASADRVTSDDYATIKFQWFPKRWMLLLPIIFLIGWIHPVVTDEWHWLALFLIIFFQTGSAWKDTHAILSKNEHVFALISVGYATVFVLIHLFSFSNPNPLEWFIWMLVVLTGVRYLTMNRLIADPQPSGKPEKVFHFFKEWLYSGWNDAVQLASKWVDKIAILLLFPLTDFAVYYNGSIEIPMLATVLSSVTAVVLTRMSSGMNRSVLSTASMFTTTAHLMSLWIFPLFWMAFVYRETLIPFVFGENYLKSADFFAITAWVIPLRIASWGGLLQVLQSGKYLVIGAIGELGLIILLILILFPFLDVFAFPIAWVIGTWCQTIYYVSIAVKFSHLKWTQWIEWQLFVRFIFFGGLTLTSAFVWKDDVWLAIGFTLLAFLIISGWEVRQIFHRISGSHHS